MPINLTMYIYQGKYKSTRIIKTSGVSKGKQVDEEINIDVNTEIDSATKKIQCRFLADDLHTLETKIRCYKCK